MSTEEENYLDNLLKSLTEPQESEVLEETTEDMTSVMTEVETEAITTPEIEEINIEELPDLEEPVAMEELPDLEEPVAMEELPDLEEPVVMDELPSVEEPVAVEELPELEEAVNDVQLEDLNLDDIKLDDVNLADSNSNTDEFNLDDLGLDDIDLNNIDLDNVSLDLDDADFAELTSAMEVENTPPEEPATMEELPELEEPVAIPEESVAIKEETVDMDAEPEASIGDMFSSLDEEEGTSNTDTVDISDLDLDSIDLTTLDIDSLNGDAAEPTRSLADLMADETGADEEDIADVLNLLDDDMAEIGDLLSKADSHEPVQDDMMAMLSQMADTEAEKVNASDKASEPVEESAGAEDVAVVAEKVEKKKKGRKVFKPEVDVNATVEQKPKKNGLFGKMFAALTEEWEPEPTEEELKQEAEQKAFEKQAAKEKKEEEKAAKDEEKKQKAEEAAALKKAKKEEAEKAKQAKKEAKEAKRAAQEEEEAKKGGKKRISKKKYVVVTIMAASILGGILLASELLNSYTNRMDGRKAYYAGNYKDTYLEMYGEELDESDTLLQERSKVILKMQRKLDSYQNYLKMGYELEALHALLEGLIVYDNVNLAAEQYQVSEEVEDIRADILMILSANYGLSEEQARELLQNEDEISYTKALNHIIMGTDSELVSNDVE